MFLCKKFGVDLGIKHEHTPKPTPPKCHALDGRGLINSH